MASVDLLSGVWLNDATDPPDMMMWRVLREFTRVKEAPARFVPLAGGRVRMIRQQGRTVEWSLRLQHVDRSGVEWLEGHVGRVVCIRDNRGSKVFGAYTDVDVDEAVYGGRAHVSFTLVEVSWSEAV